MDRISDTKLIDKSIAIELGLSAEEYDYIVNYLKRNITYAEAGVLSAMYSEHCSYKSSKDFLKKLFTKGEKVLQGPGENAGIVEIGDDLAVAFKMESHNHPSFIEPYQGAATGVGGILRDIFTMGARPIVSMDALFFGVPEDNKTRSIMRGVVKGIGDYGNSVGVPTCRGLTFFQNCYKTNPLVNAFTLGVLRKDSIYRGYAKGVGNIVVYVGAKTGRDGVRGAIMASKEFSLEVEPERPAVQVGDPFTEKLLLEATLEAMNKGLILGIQDMGASGLTSSSFEMAGRASTGLEINLNKIPCREKGMTAYEILLSESQERMLLVTEKKHWQALSELFDKWDLHAEIIGHVTDANTVKMFFNNEKVVELPVELVLNPPKPKVKIQKPQYLENVCNNDFNELKASTLENKIRLLIDSWSFASPEPLVEQYDSMVGNRTINETLSDSAILRIRGSKNISIAVTVDSNSRISFLNPKEGAKWAISESVLNLAIKGAKPIGITDCLNFGSPTSSEVLWQFDESVQGITEACEYFNIPVVSGNVSFYNETDGLNIYPTPVIGMVGILEKRNNIPKTYINSKNKCIFLLGSRYGNLSGSLLAEEFYKRTFGIIEEVNLKSIKNLLNAVLKIIEENLIESAHDISEGGLIVSTLEMLFYGNNDSGIRLFIPEDSDIDSLLFGEAPGRVLIASTQESEEEIYRICHNYNVEITNIAQCINDRSFEIFERGKLLFKEDIKKIKEKWKNKWRILF